MAKTDSKKFPTIQQCESKAREEQTVVSDMDGTLLIGRSSFPYFALVAFEVGGIFRLLFLVLASPLAGILYYFISESAGIRVLVFATFAGMKVSDIESVARAVLPKFYSSDLHPTHGVFSSCGKKCVLTANPRLCRNIFEGIFRCRYGYWDGDMYLQRKSHWICESSPESLLVSNKAVALHKAFGSTSAPDVDLVTAKLIFPS
ncbi:CAAX geranylgeranyltransferase alpha subunit [Datura stramonium]|uniref:CAAX geranylgeranyltransferase alpha subunit n=1 Tax=Datura stramonium TaxID=4076 RepID=A0ABS8VSX6_DATST|nr:CAAX geranylgeranyltransferase alpha subunit [Datura stramonium]